MSPRPDKSGFGILSRYESRPTGIESDRRVGQDARPTGAVLGFTILVQPNLRTHSASLNELMYFQSRRAIAPSS